MSRLKKEYFIYLFLFLFLFPYFLPSYFNSANIQFVLKLCSGLKLLSIAVILLAYIKNFKKIKWNATFFLVLIYLFYILIVSYFMKSNWRAFFSISFNIGGFFLVANYFFQTNTKKFIRTLLFIYEVLITLNLVTLFLFPDGLMKTTGGIAVYLLGIDNTHISVIFPALVVSLIYSGLEGDKLLFRTKYLLVLSTISFLKSWSATSLIGIFLIWMYVFFRKYLNRWKKCNMKTYLFIIGTLFISIIILHVQDLFSFLIVDILHKDITFTGRTRIWAKASELILERPIFGYGNKMIYQVQMGKKLLDFSHSHNMILQIFYMGGAVGFFLFGSIMIQITKILKQHYNKLSVMLSFLIFSYFLISLVESYQLFPFFTILMFVFNIEFLEREMKE